VVLLAVSASAAVSDIRNFAIPTQNATVSPLLLTGTVAAKVFVDSKTQGHYGDPSKESCEADEQVRASNLAPLMLRSTYHGFAVIGADLTTTDHVGCFVHSRGLSAAAALRLCPMASVYSFASRKVRLYQSLRLLVPPHY
jgi:hypothetical protein